MDALIANLSEAEKDVLIAKLLKRQEKSRLSEKQILEKHPHVVPGTLDWDEGAKKQFVLIKCTVGDCTETRKTFTSDVWQIKACDGHRAALRKVRKENERLLLKELLKAREPKGEPVEADEAE